MLRDGRGETGETDVGRPAARRDRRGETGVARWARQETANGGDLILLMHLFMPLLMHLLMLLLMHLFMLLLMHLFMILLMYLLMLLTAQLDSQELTTGKMQGART